MAVVSHTFIEMALWLFLTLSSRNNTNLSQWQFFFFLSNCLLFSSFSVLKFREVLLCQDGSRLGLMLEIFLVLHNPCYALDLPHFPPSVKREAYQSLCCRVNPRGRRGRSVSCFINGKAGLRSSSNYRWWQVFSKAAAWSWDCAPSDIIEMNRNYRLGGRQRILGVKWTMWWYCY